MSPHPRPERALGRSPYFPDEEIVDWEKGPQFPRVTESVGGRSHLHGKHPEAAQEPGSLVFLKNVL